MRSLRTKWRDRRAGSTQSRRPPRTVAETQERKTLSCANSVNWGENRWLVQEDHTFRTDSWSGISGSILIPERLSDLVFCTSLPFYIHILLLSQNFLSLFVFTSLKLKNKCSLLHQLIWLLIRLSLTAMCTSSPMCGPFKYLWSYIHLDTALWEKNQMGSWGTMRIAHCTKDKTVPRGKQWRQGRQARAQGRRSGKWSLSESEEVKIRDPFISSGTSSR